MSGPLLFFAEHILLVLCLGLLLGLGCLTAAIQILRRAHPAPVSLRRRLGPWTLAAVGAALAVTMVWIFSQLGPTLLSQNSMVGEMAPTLEFQPLESGRETSLKDLQGQVVVVNFWATWCPPCREEMPDLERLQGDLSDSGLVVLNISDEPPGIVENYLETNPMSTLHATVEPLPWPEFGRPTTFVVDREGVVRRVVQGSRTYEQFVNLVTPWL